MKKPETEKWWTILYYGHRGSGKTLHQARVVLEILEYLEALYKKDKGIHEAIVYSIQKFNKQVEEKYLGRRLFYWNDVEDLQFCPREKCWKTPKKHRLHGCYLIFDDIATILPADNWNMTPMWLRKTFSQARHNSVRVLANLQDPFSCDVNFRRYTDMAFRFRKIMGSPDPDETKPKIKRIWGIYIRRKVSAELLWKTGDLTDEEAQEWRQKHIEGGSAIGDMWRAVPHWIGKKICNLYDTTQDVKEYTPRGFKHTELYCIDPKHNHKDKTAENYCAYKKVYHELV